MRGTESRANNVQTAGQPARRNATERLLAGTLGTS